jgi:hypothetical protein
MRRQAVSAVAGTQYPYAPEACPSGPRIHRHLVAACVSCGYDPLKPETQVTPPPPPTSHKRRTLMTRLLRT